MMMMMMTLLTASTNQQRKQHSSQKRLGKGNQKEFDMKDIIGPGKGTRTTKVFLTEDILSDK